MGGCHSYSETGPCFPFFNKEMEMRSIIKMGGEGVVFLSFRGFWRDENSR